MVSLAAFVTNNGVMEIQYLIEILQAIKTMIYFLQQYKIKIKMKSLLEKIILMNQSNLIVGPQRREFKPYMSSLKRLEIGNVKKLKNGN